LKVCERVLAEDLCREDIHRLAMRCYSRLNQPHLAIRQFQSCTRQLHNDLGVAPDAATRELNDKIRRREPI
jgi:DNA-binding SARP family transcriptional activator